MSTRRAEAGNPYGALAPMARQLSEVTGRKMLPTTYTAYLDAVSDLRQYSKIFKHNEDQALKWLRALSPQQRQTLYDLYAVISQYTQERLYALIKAAEAEGDDYGMSDDDVTDATTQLTLQWPESFTLLQEGDFDISEYAREVHPHLELGEDTEAEILAAESGLDSKLKLMATLGAEIKQRYGVDDKVKMMLKVQSDIIEMLVEQLKLNK